MSFKFSKKWLKVILPSSVVSKAEKFAEAVVETVNYADSNQRNKTKIKNDHFISKIGEEAVCAAFRHFGQPINEPDYEIYKGTAKSWAADLVTNETEIAVKTQARSQAKKYGLSWTFQSSEKRFDPILNEPESWVCFVVCDDTKANYECFVYQPQQIKNLLFEPPLLPHLKGKKQVVYAKNFK